MTQTNLPFADPELKRVSGRIASWIMDYMHGVVHEFTMADLHSHVSVYTCGKIAPGSVDRVLRQLRKTGQVNYRVVNRRQSLYEVIR